MRHFKNLDLSNINIDLYSCNSGSAGINVELEKVTVSYGEGESISFTCLEEIKSVARQLEVLASTITGFIEAQ